VATLAALLPTCQQEREPGAAAPRSESGLDEIAIARVVRGIERRYPPPAAGRGIVLWDTPDEVVDALRALYADAPGPPPAFHRPDHALRLEDGSRLDLAGLLPAAEPGAAPLARPRRRRVQLRPSAPSPSAPPAPRDEPLILLWEQDISDFIDLSSALPELLRATQEAAHERAPVRWGESAGDWEWHPGAPGGSVNSMPTEPFDRDDFSWTGGTFCLLRRSLELSPVQVGAIQVGLDLPTGAAPLRGRLYWTTRSHAQRRDTQKLVAFAGPGRIRFPVGDSPRWLAGGEVTTLTVVFENPPPELSVGAVRLLPPDRRARALPPPVEPIFIPAGLLVWGSDPHSPLRYPTEAENDTIMVPAFGIDPYPWPGRGGVFPTVNVTLFEARYLCAMQGKRLCREGEWERACKGPKSSALPYGARFDPERCFTPGDFDSYAMRRNGVFPGCVSGFGVADMVGNVNEWTASTLTRTELETSPREPNYGIFAAESKFPPDAPPLAELPMLRGGGDWGESQREWRCAHREHFHFPGERYPDDGFRCCASR